MHPEPSYLDLLRRGELERRVQGAWERLSACDLCARGCRADRHHAPETAFCRTGARAVVHGHGPHHGEEDPLRGWAGSGTIFFSSCNLRCVYCQNWETSQQRMGEEVEAAELASIMLRLQAQGCHNVNLVSPSHFIAPILNAVAIAAEQGLCLPLVYNTGGYDSLEGLALLDGVVDVYMPDVKYSDPRLANRYSAAPDYVAVNRAAVREMHRQVGDLVLDERGVAQRGLLVRHLVLPGHPENTEGVLDFLAREISPETYVNVMGQYYPCYRAGDCPPIDEPLSADEHRRALGAAVRAGLTRLDERFRR